MYFQVLHLNKQNIASGSEKTHHGHVNIDQGQRTITRPVNILH